MEIDASQAAEGSPAAAPTIKQEGPVVEAAEEPAAASPHPPPPASQGAALPPSHLRLRLRAPYASPCTYYHMLPAMRQSISGLDLRGPGPSKIQRCLHCRAVLRPCCASLYCPSTVVQADPGVTVCSRTRTIARSSVLPHCPFVQPVHPSSWHEQSCQCWPHSFCTHSACRRRFSTKRLGPPG